MSIIFSNKYFARIIYLILFFKIVLLFWSAHPFDFWAFVNQFQRDSLYGWSFFDGWNKGNLLYVVWYPMYGVYLKVVEIFSLTFDSVTLLHFFFKIPFIFIDLLTGFLIFKSIFALSNNYIKARAGLLVWFTNPLIFFVYGIHGHYEIIISFALALIIFGLLVENTWLVGVGLVTGFVTKYFIIIFSPFIILYFLSKREYKQIIIISSIFVVGVFISYIHLFNNPALLGQTFNSIVKLSQAHSSNVVNGASIKPLNIAAAINYIFNPNEPITNLRNGLIFDVATRGGMLLLSLIWLAHVFWRAYRIFYKKNKYDLKLLAIDIFASILYFLLGITNFQKHYLVWIMPFLVIFFYKKVIWSWIFITITVTGFIYAFKGEYGPRTFFLDIAYLKEPMALNNASSETKYMLGAIIILMIILALFLLVFNRGDKTSEDSKNSVGFYYAFISICWTMLIIVNIQMAWSYYLNDAKPSNLAYAEGVLHRGAMYGNFESNEVNDNKVIFSNNSKNNLLIFNGLEKISDDYFSTYIIIKNVNRVNDVKYALEHSFFNECELINFKDGIKNYSNRLDYSGFEVSVKCLNKYENKIVLKDNSQIDSADVELLVSNKKADFLYSKELSGFIFFQSIVGILVILGMIYVSFVMIKVLSFGG